ncbi:MAG: TIGR04283 family arsenosugar biosynthesis glycosyltransferase [Verrucomicrobia subdivision 3 bacterium]|nr:TIGR04283 family arsenosugar biosynthesis glycosyltransferase [Limisphaerales bacterium]
MNLLFGKKWFSWPRLACLLITLVLLFWIFRRIDFSTLLATFRRLNPLWFVLAFATYGVAMVAGGLRWHLALRVTDTAMHLGASCRLFLMGHFFFVALFGAAGGDAAKSAVYSRWYGFDLARVIAAAPLDRALGLGGPLLLMGVLVGLAAATGGFEPLRHATIQWPGTWVLVTCILAAVILIAVILWKPAGDSVWARTARAFRRGGARLALTPGIAVPGLLYAFAAQLALSTVLAFNVQSVTHQPLEWAQVAWTFPVITLFSCLPFTVAGAGVREIAAIAFLAPYGVTEGECVAASMLTLFHKIAWAGNGAVVLWLEQARRLRHEHRPPQEISVVIPALNEASSLPETIRRLKAIPEIREIIVASADSSDHTSEIARELGCAVVPSIRGRGVQMRAGAEAARSDVILFVHADTWLPRDAGHAALNCLRDPVVVAGGYWKVFRERPLLLLGSRWKCAARLFVGRRIAGDQCLFVRREALEKAGGVPAIDLMEDFELCRRLRRHGRLALAEAVVVTSARRFRDVGVLKTYWRMWWVTMLWRLGVPPARLRAIYDKGTAEAG